MATGKRKKDTESQETEPVDNPTVKQTKYWKKMPSTVDGMLGGLGSLDPIDCKGSMTFINMIIPVETRKRFRVLDVGAGIGRVTKHVLIPAGFGSVDLLDSSERFLQDAKTFVGSSALKNTYCTTMDKFSFEAAPWDLIWVQWVAIYLPDKEFVTFFKKAADALVTKYSNLFSLSCTVNLTEQRSPCICSS
eukprot:m.125498 g.125498  ORF g.125498 m.125498 type:complete len:191 (-) comp14498_c0_seq5:1412-1984(-)